MRILILIITCFLFISGKPLEEIPEQKTNYYLGFNLMPSANSGLVNYVIIYAPEGKIQTVTTINKNLFFFHMTGKIQSQANPKNENFFIKYELGGCGIFKDSIFNKTTFNCNLIDDLWKLRYQEYPYALKQGSEFEKNGWAKTPMAPSHGQMQILRKYGITNLDDYFFGENAMRLLRDMQDPAWITVYMGS